MAKSTICVVDWTDFTYAANLLTNHFHNVFYNPNPSKSGFTNIAAAKLGTGIKNLTQITDIWKYEDDIDIFIICDIDFYPLANKLRKDGHYVWGSGDAERLELDRSFFLDELKEVGLPVPKTDIIKTFTKEVEYLKGKKDIWVKINKYRGIAETFHIDGDEELTKIKMEDIDKKVKPFANDEDLVFLNQEPIKSKIEYARDSYAVNGVMPDKFFLGFEKKGIAYISKFIDNSERVKEAAEIDEKFTKILKKYNYTGFLGYEIRISEKDNTHYLIDPCLRCGAPCTASYLFAITNWGEIIERGVKGELINPISKYKYCAEIVIHYKYEGYSPIKYKNIENGMFLPDTYATRDGVDWRMPSNQLYCDSKKAGICVGGGQTIEEAIENCTKVFESIKGEGLGKDNPLEDFSKEVSEGFKKATGYVF